MYGESFNVTPSAIPLTSRCQKRHEHVPAKLDQCSAFASVMKKKGLKMVFAV